MKEIRNAPVVLLGIFLLILGWGVFRNPVHVAHTQSISGDTSYLLSSNSQFLADIDFVDIGSDPIKPDAQLRSVTFLLLCLTYILVALYIARGCLFYEKTSYHSLWQKTLNSL